MQKTKEGGREKQIEEEEEEEERRKLVRARTSCRRLWRCRRGGKLDSPSSCHSSPPSNFSPADCPYSTYQTRCTYTPHTQTHGQINEQTDRQRDSREEHRTTRRTTKKKKRQARGGQTEGTKTDPPLSTLFFFSSSLDLRKRRSVLS